MTAFGSTSADEKKGWTVRSGIPTQVTKKQFPVEHVLKLRFTGTLDFVHCPGLKEV
jgi:hypothetical protein